MVLSGEILVLLLQDGVVLLMGWDPVGCRGVWSRKLFSRNPINQHGTTQLARWNTFSTRPDILQQNWRLLTKKWKKLPTPNFWCGTEREKKEKAQCLPIGSDHCYTTKMSARFEFPTLWHVWCWSRHYFHHYRRAFFPPGTPALNFNHGRKKVWSEREERGISDYHPANISSISI